MTHVIPEMIKKQPGFIRSVILCWSMLFVLLFILSFPFGYHLLPDIGRYTGIIFDKWVALTGKWLSLPPFDSRITSDATSMYIDVLNVSVLSLILAIPSAAFCKKKNIGVLKLYDYFIVLISYYLALQLLKYGFNKVFKWQFFLPEPNTLFTTVGDTHRDLLYWSTMGLSRSYTMFSGVIEVIPALLLLFRRTRVPGAFILSGVLLNVVWVNVSYDISVKIYSCFLLLLSLTIAMPAYGLLYRFFVLRLSTVPKPAAAMLRPRWVYVSIKVLVIAALLIESLWIYFSSGNYNDDAAPRPPLHGAWQVQQFSSNDTTLIKDQYWEKVFVHRRGYFIILQHGEMQDYLLDCDTAAGKLTLKNYETGTTFPLRYQQLNDSMITINGLFLKDTISVQLKRIDLKTLKALQNEFNWTSD